MKALPKLVITDIDGVWTDGGMYYDNTGYELKKFNTSDSAGVLFLKQLNIPIAIITGENTEIVSRRAAKLNIKHLYQGVGDKVAVTNKLCAELHIDLQEVAYMGDDIGDYQLLKRVGISAAPANAPAYVKSVVDIITTKSGGEGAFREFVETVLTQSGVNLQELVEEITSKTNH
jgi:YrbI family 3-deoxy-D-manno-octulosonate 8-phosphate phosphatase